MVGEILCVLPWLMSTSFCLGEANTAGETEERDSVMDRKRGHLHPREEDEGVEIRDVSFALEDAEDALHVV